MMGVQWTGKIAAVSLGVGVLLGLGSGLGIGWKLYRTKPLPPEVYHPAVIQPDGSTILESKPDPSAKPPTQVPHGAVVEHITHVTVTPKPLPSIPTGPQQGGESLPAATLPCPTVTVDLTAIRMPDGSHRVIASSPNGTIEGGSVDIPVEDARPIPKATPSAVGYVGNFKTRHGVFYDRDFGPFRVGVEALRETLPATTNYQLNAKVGVRF